ncbi:MAG: M16 family metallopeptidase [Planctomycetota bacterium]|jgi:predicted Zn-dependent peptidase
MSTLTCIPLACGATLVVEPIRSVRSAAIQFLLPVGSSTDPDDADGQAALLSELIFRGAGGLSSREHSDAMDRLGLRRSSSVTTHHMSLAAVCLGDRLPDALPLLTMMVRHPALDESAIEPVRSLSLQSLDGLDDDPRYLVTLRLRERHLPAPFNRHGYGVREVLRHATIDQLRGAWAQRCRPSGTIIAAAGAVDATSLARQLDQLLDGWTGAVPEPTESAPARRGCDHLEQDTAQVHIAVGYDAPAERDEHAVLERVAAAVLSGGTSARLFTEVRQKRSLCYSVGASYRAGRDRGYVVLYAGTTPQRAQETLDVSLEQIGRMTEGADEVELQRAAVGLKSSLVMQGESTSARAAAIGYDWFRLGRVRSLEQRLAEIDAVDLDRLNAYLAGRQPGPFTLSSIGPVPLEIGRSPVAASSGGSS